VGKYSAKTAYFETEVYRLFNIPFENTNSCRKHISEKKKTYGGFKLLVY